MTTKISGVRNITNYTINTEQLSNTATAAFAKSLEPKIQYANVASNTYTVLDDTAVNIGGGYIVVTGAEFQSGATILIDTTPASSVTYVNSTTLRAQVPAKSAASYNLYVVNPDGGIGIKPAGITYSGFPTWVTTSPLANVTSNTVFSGSFSATDAVSYSNTSILPTGFNLLANGYYYGNISVGSETTYNFTIRATDNELQDSDKDFSLTTIVSLPSYTVNYLVVAGGGGGGAKRGGGGGAGGYLANSVNFSPGSIYTITVGAGGSKAPASTNNAQPGSQSQITNPSPAFNSITSIGGGKGGGYNGSSESGSPGGSGGGGCRGEDGVPTASGGSGTPGQGNPGGANNGTGPVNPGTSGGGGGGGGAGASGTSVPIGGSGGPGGSGSTWPFTGSTYAGGGGGGATQMPYSGGSGGSGGGGSGTGSGDASSGSSSTGGGGGGAGDNPGWAGGNGGSGVVILAIPTPNYPGSAPGATVTTPPAAPGKTVLTYTSSGTYTA